MAATDDVKQGMLNELRRIRKDLIAKGLRENDPTEWNRFEYMFWSVIPYLRPKYVEESKTVVKVE